MIMGSVLLKMRAMVVIEGGGLVELRKLEKPKIRDDDQVLIKIEACGVNRCDLTTKRPAKSKYSYYCLGHECSGTIIAIGKHVKQWNVGDKLCAILDEGGGYAEQVAVPAKHLLPIPTNVSLADGASLPFAACSIWLALFGGAANHHSNSNCLSTKTILIHEGVSKIGSMAIQFAKYFGMKVIATAESRQQLVCEKLGADFCFDRKTQGLVDNLSKKAHGVDIILDYGASYLEENLQCLKQEGKILIVDLHGESKTSVSLVDIHGRNCELQVADIQNQSMEQKALMIEQVQKLLWPAIEEGKVRPIVQSRLHLTAAGVAPQFLVDNLIVQNIILYP